MALKPHVLETQAREKRHRHYLAAPELGEKFPSIKEVTIDLRFRDPDGKANPSPYKRIFDADMQAFFEFSCPMRDCVGGGYSLSGVIMEALSRRRSDISGSLPCEGKRPREKGADPCCDIELRYQVKVRRK